MLIIISFNDTSFTFSLYIFISNQELLRKRVTKRQYFLYPEIGKNDK